MCVRLSCTIRETVNPTLSPHGFASTIYWVAGNTHVITVIHEALFYLNSTRFRI